MMSISDWVYNNYEIGCTGICFDVVYLEWLCSFLVWTCGVKNIMLTNESSVG